MTPASRIPSGARRARHLGLLALLWGVIVLYLTTIPFDFSADRETVAQGWREFRVSAYFLRHVHRPAWTDIFANVAMFIPWAALVAARSRVSGSGRRGAAAAAIGSAILFSLCIEFLQIFARSRYASAWDVSLNTAGGVAGFLLGWYVPSLWHRVSPAVDAALSTRPVRTLALTAACVYWLVSLAPFDFRWDAESLDRATRLARVVPFGPTIGHETLAEDPVSWAADLVAAMLFGGLFGLAWRESRAPRWTRHLGPGLAAAALAIGVEAGQLLIAGRRSDVTVGLVFLVGGTIGGLAVAAAPARSARDWGRAAIAGWAIAATLAGLAPAGFTWPTQVDLERIVWVPFMPHFRRPDLVAISDLTIQLLTFVPFGGFLALLWPKMRLRRAVAVGAVGGAFIELLQLLSRYRATDSTGVVMAAFGAGLGFAVWRSAARRASPPAES